ncbi:K(+) efflux antiporter 3, chloroplastic-like [Mercurialis annua]|uniref:K(+) efflux antiporter 3, chloroplastic-like n=1 Tax=Mercurialis annua TaxID=3986 RepID=UPI0024AF44B8|nr:K(+) efflux antiporter 3, chloroplastic-like [Mercurialis annua]
MQTGLQLGSKLLKGLGVMSDDVDFASRLVQDSMEIQAQGDLSKTDGQAVDVMKPMQVGVDGSVGIEVPVQKSLRQKQIEQSEDQGKGVLYCELSKENGFPVKSDDVATEQKNMIET